MGFSTAMLIRYVEQIERSVAFYQMILKAPPIEHHPNFAMFKVNDQFMLGLWNRQEVTPAVTQKAGASELDLLVATRNDVDALFQQWKNAHIPGLNILHHPTVLDFGYTFTCADHDGHRIRVFTPAQAPSA